MPSMEPKNIGRYRVLRPVPTHGRDDPAYLALVPAEPGGPERSDEERMVVVQTIAGARSQDRAVTLARLQHDADVSAGLPHPGLVRVVDVGEDLDRGPFLVREYVNGPSLRSLPAMEVDLEAALRILIQTAHALRAADTGGVAPRPLGLEHLFLTPAGQVKVTVFGRPQASPPAAFTSPADLARVGLELIAGRDLGGEGGGQLPELAAILDRELARTFSRALSGSGADRFEEIGPFIASMIAVAPLTEPRRRELLHLNDRSDPILEDEHLASWVRGVWRTGAPPLRSEAQPDELLEALPPLVEPAGGAPLAHSAGRLRHWIAAILIAAALAAAAWITLSIR